MKKLLFVIVILIFTSIAFHSEAQTKKIDDPDHFDVVVNNHDQIFQASGIPSAIELVLKYCKAVDQNFYELQNEWQDKTDGSFGDFDNKKLYGITFTQKFKLPRNANFPLDSLFRTIENELRSGKKVIIALQLEEGWPIFVVDKQTQSGEFVSYSKLGSHTLIIRSTKEIVRRSNGTEIMTYRARPGL